MSKMATYLGLSLAQDLFEHCEKAATVLQSSTLTQAGGRDTINLLRSVLTELGTNEVFERKWTMAEEMAASLDLEIPTLPRVRHPSRRAVEARANDAPPNYESFQEMIYHDFKSALKGLDEELARRFDGVGLKTMVLIEEVLCSATAGSIVDEKVQELTQALGDDLEKTTLIHELRVIRFVVKDAKTVEDVRMLPKEARQIFPETLKLLRIATCAATSTATAERSFSTLRRLKTWLRTSMTQARLTHLAILHCHREVSLDVDAILREFVGANELRRKTFGNL